MENIKVDKPWGFEYSVFKDGTSVRLLHLNKGEETSYHKHLDKDVLLILLKGKAKLTRDGHDIDYMEDIPLKPMFVKQVPRGISHKTLAIEDSVIIEIESSDDVHDLVRVIDKYKRGQGYEVEDIIAIDEVINDICD